MKEWLCNFFSNSINADWAVAFTTIFLALVTLIFYFIDDSYTKLLKKVEINKFNKLAYDFLRVSFASWSLEFKAPTSQSQTVEEHIDQFRQNLLENKIYMGWREKRRFNRYVQLAKNHGLAWSANKFNDVSKAQQKILIEMEWLSKRIGKETEFKKIKEDYNTPQEKK
ncbi:TPA: hypothetical protein ACPSKY_002576 [Legionella bozemanae]